MRIFLNTLREDLRRTVCGKAFALSVLAFTAVTFLTGWEEISFFTPDTPVTYAYMIFQYLDFYLLFLLFAAIPGATLFCADWENRFIRFSAQRGTKLGYGISKGIACFVSAVGVVMASEWLNILLLLLKGHPAYTESSNHNFGAYGILAGPSTVYLYFLAVIFIKACCAGCFAVFSLWLSTKIPNVFVTLASPLLAFYLLNTLAMALRLPSVFMVSNLARVTLSFGGPAETTLVAAGVFVLLGVLFTALFACGSKRRLENG